MKIILELTKQIGKKVENSAQQHVGKLHWKPKSLRRSSTNSQIWQNFFPGLAAKTLRRGNKNFQVRQQRFPRGAVKTLS
jgi:hypothetical protein